MKIIDFGTLQIARSDVRHTGASTISAMGQTPLADIPSAAHDGLERTSKSFGEYLREAFGAMNAQQMDVAKLERQVMTDPDSVDVQDVTIAMAKARMSLTLAQTVIDRLVTDWNELSAPR